MKWFLSLALSLLAAGAAHAGNYAVLDAGADSQGICPNAWPPGVVGNYTETGTLNGAPYYQNNSFYLYRAAILTGTGWVLGTSLGQSDINNSSVAHFATSSSATPPTGTVYDRAPSGCGRVNVQADVVVPPPSAPTMGPLNSGVQPYITGGSTGVFWTAVAGVVGYKLDVATDPGFTSFHPGYNGFVISASPTPPTSATVTGLNGAGITYYFRVRSYNGGGDSANSATVSTTTIPATPAIQAATTVRAQSFTAHWSASTGATLHRLQVCTDAGFTSCVPNYNPADLGDSSSALVTGLLQNTVYYYRVAAGNANGYSTYSNGASVTTNALPTLGGTFTTNGTVNDNATIAPFAAVTVSDANNDPLTIAISYTAANGTLSGTGLSGSAGSYMLTAADPSVATTYLRALVFQPTYAQGPAGSTVTTTFSLVPNDGVDAGTSNSSTVVTTTMTNTVPLFVGAVTSITVSGNSSANDVKGLLHARDPDNGQTLTWSVQSNAAHGTALASATGTSSGGLDIAPAGTITYTPSTGYSGSDSFIIQVTDGFGTALRTINVTVQPLAPVANAVSSTVAYGSAGNPITLNITGGPATGVAVVAAASHGTAVASGTSITYTPATGYGGPDSFTYTASNGTGTSAPATVSITVSAPTITYTPSNPPNGAVGVAFSQSIAGASGGTGPYTYSLAAGSLPAGLSLASDGTISGTPTAIGTSNFSVRATDSSSGTPPATGPFSSANRPLSLTITAPTITLAPAALPDMRAGTPYNQTVSASGGAAPYTYAVTSGALPPGLTLNSTTGTLTGTATASDTFTFTITATDNGGFSGQQAYNVNSLVPNFTLTFNVSPSPVVGVPFSRSVVAGGGTAPYTYARVAGSLPTGLTLSTAGVISGTPTAAGNFNFTIIARDSTTGPGSPFAVGSGYMLAVAAPTVTVTPAAGALPSGSVGAAYSQALAATGGMAPYTYTVTAGTLPAGLALDSASGLLSGTPAAAGLANFTVTATDANSFSGSAAYSLAVAPSANADLTALAFSAGALTPAFAPGTTSYTLALDNAASSLTVTPTVAASGATVTVNGAAVASGAASSPLSLNIGANTVTVVGTAPNGSTTRTYTIAATRAALQSVVDTASGMVVSISNSSPTCTLTASSFAPASSAATAPPAGFSFPYSMAAFTAAQCDTGSVLTVTLTFPNPVPQGAVLMKYNPAATPPWQPFTPAINGNQVVYTINDGGVLDLDSAVNGQFVDPVVLAVPLAATGIPTLNEWGLLLLSALAGMLGWRQLRRVRCQRGA